MRARRGLGPRLGRKTWVIVGLLVVAASQMIPAGICHAQPAAVSVDLTGWGWCLAYRDVANVTLSLEGTATPRSENTTEIIDLYLTGTISFNWTDRTDAFDVELRGTKARSLFFLKEVSGGETPLIAEIEGTWFSESDPNYVACEGRLAVPVPDHLAKPYIFVLRTPDATVPAGVPGNYASNLEAAIRKGTMAFDTLADRLADYGAEFKQLLGTVLTQVAAIFMEVRNLGVPYFI